MKGCEAYKALCGPTSVVEACVEPGPLPDMIPEGGRGAAACGACRDTPVSCPRTSLHADTESAERDARGQAQGGELCQPPALCSVDFLKINLPANNPHAEGIDMGPAGMNNTAPLCTYNVKQAVDVSCGGGVSAAWE